MATANLPTNLVILCILCILQLIFTHTSSTIHQRRHSSHPSRLIGHSQPRFSAKTAIANEIDSVINSLADDYNDEAYQNNLLHNLQNIYYYYDGVKPPKIEPKTVGTVKVEGPSMDELDEMVRKALLVKEHLDKESRVASFTERKEALATRGFTKWDIGEILYGDHVMTLYRCASEYAISQIKKLNEQSYPFISKRENNIFGPGLYLCDEPQQAYYKAQSAAYESKMNVPKWMVKAEVVVGTIKTYPDYQVTRDDCAYDDKVWEGYTQRTGKDGSNIKWDEFLKSVRNADSFHLLATPDLYPAQIPVYKEGDKPWKHHPIKILDAYPDVARQGEWFVPYKNQVKPLEIYEVIGDGKGNIKPTGFIWDVATGKKVKK
eukprot:793217_1